MVQLSSTKTIHGLDLNSNPIAVDPYKERGGSRSSTLLNENTVLGRQRMSSNRKGFDYFTASTSALVTAMFEYQGDLIEHQQGDTSLWYGTPTSGTRTQYSG